MVTRAPALDEALEKLRLEGAIFLRAEYTESWAFESLDGPTTAGLLHPGADRVILFHVIASGRCWVSVPGGERHWADNGDVIVLPYGDTHQMGGVDDTDPVSITTIMSPPPWEELPVISLGTGGSQTDVVCGYLHSDDPLFDPALRAFPPVFVVRPPEGPAAQLVRAGMEFALQHSGPPGSVSTRVPEALLVEVLRIHLASAPAADGGWVTALHDPVLAPAMARLHAEPERKWTVAELAGEVAVSRSLLDERFRKVLGRSPIRYLTDWRMHIAADLLATQDITVAAVARRVGYDSEEAFSRAFKRARGCPPSQWAEHRLGL